MFVFPIFVRVFLYEFLGRKSFRFPKIMKILSSELNILPYSISQSLHYYYTLSII